MMTLAFEIFLFALQSDFLRALKSYDTEPMALLPLKYPSPGKHWVPWQER
jgi:hypothetical protein